MPLQLPLNISLKSFKDRLRGNPKKNYNTTFTGEDLGILGKDYWSEGRDLEIKFIEPTWKFPVNGGGYYPTEEIYKRLVKLGRIIPPPSSQFAR